MSSLLIIVSSLVAAGGCVLYAYTRGLRAQRRAWWVMCLPLLFHASVYIWINLYNPPLDDRVFPVRISDVLEKSFIAMITISLAYFNIKEKWTKAH
jgi:hypothetical protein